MYDLLITGGTVIDGTGKPGYRADIAITQGKIQAVGDLAGYPSREHIDARGLVISPGFIDIHTHSDVTVLVNPALESSVLQGVTTELAGNCGLCVGQVPPGGGFRFERRIAAHIREFNWNSLKEFLQRIAEQGIAANFALLAGHGTMRRRVMGNVNRPPDAGELREMQKLVEKAMEEGAFGLSTGLEYPPGRFADTEEIIALAQVAAEKGGFYATHLRDEGDHLLEAVEEALVIGEKARIRVQLSHHKAEGRKNWGKVRQSLRRIEEARKRGVDVACDQYPYTAFMTGLSIKILPSWALEGTSEEIVERLKHPETRRRILQEIRSRKVDWDLLQIAIARGHRSCQGKTLAQLAEDQGRSPEEVALDLLVEERGVVACIAFEMSEEDIQTVLRWPYTAIGSDSASTAPQGPLSEDCPHPRHYGTFPRILGRYVRELGVLSLEEAIRRMTSLPADRIGLTDRGRIAPGYWADLVIFDPHTVVDCSTYRHPHQAPKGINYVLVNGEVVVEEGLLTENLPGRVLLGPSSAERNLG